jgi:hypothetical protein
MTRPLLLATACFVACGGVPEMNASATVGGTSPIDPTQAAGGAAAGGASSAGGTTSAGGGASSGGGSATGGGVAAAGGVAAGGGLSAGGGVAAAGGAASSGGGAAGGQGTTNPTAIDTIAFNSACYRYQWLNRGQMPRGFAKGLARTFAKSLCAPTRADVVVVSQAQTTDTVHDALAWYQSQFTAAGMSNTQAGVDTLRHVYVLLFGLGMRESSGEHCVGRDTSASNTTAASAEAGAWQTSYDSHGLHPQLDVIFATYRTNDTHCHLSTYAEGVTCSAANWQSWGSGAGYDFQVREKACPVFAAEYAAVMMRVSGGSLAHYGPLRTHAAEVRTECDAMLSQVQQLVTANPGLCSAL